MVFAFLTMLIGTPAGKLFGEIIDAVKDPIKRYVGFKSELEDFKSRLGSVDPNVAKIDQLNQQLDHPKEEAEKLKVIVDKGKDLVDKCSGVGRINCWKRIKYTKRIRKLKKSLKSYAQIDIAVQTARDTKQIQLTVNDLSSRLSRVVVPGDNPKIFRALCAPPQLPPTPVGLEIPLRQLKRRVLQDEAPLVVLSAAGGCGKTTLAAAFCHDPQVKGKFGKNIFFVTVSRSLSLLLIVKRLFQHTGYVVPDLGSEEDAVIQLKSLLKQLQQEDQDPLLLVLDDVWPSSETLLDKFRFDMKNYHIIVISHSEFPRFGSTYKLPKMNATDAMTLFCQSAFRPDGSSYQPDRDLVKKIVEGCKGYPLVISVIGKSVCGKAAAEWRKRAKECGKASFILGNSEVLERLRTSFDALDDTPGAKECYIDLGAFPEDQRIPAATLIDISAELHGLDEDGTISNLNELRDRSLLDILITRKDAHEADSSYNEHLVSQHDLLRELAIQLSNKGDVQRRKRIFMDVHENQYPEWCSEQMEPLNCAKLLSINTDARFASRWIDIRAPEVQALVLNFQSECYILPEFMQTMEKLNVLAIANSGFSAAELDNFRLLSSLSNLKRLRLERVTLPSSLFASMNLSKLEKISLVMCNIDQAFRESNDQLAAAFPNLKEMNIEYCNDLVALPNGISDLIRLKKLRITNCHKLTALPWQLGNLVNLKVLRLDSCSDLEKLPATVGSLQNLEILDLSGCLGLKSLPDQIGGLQKLRKLQMIDCSGCELPSSAKKLVNLGEVIADGETAASWQLFKSHLPHLTIKVHKDNLNWLGGGSSFF